METLNQIQTQIVARKSRHNKFGGYNYRSAEDIMEAAKPLLAQTGATLLLSDEIIAIGDRIYVKATARLLVGGKDVASTTGFAREAAEKKGMDAAQVTGAASSYARKYALAGLFALDDSDDPDATNTHGKDASTKLSKEQIKTITRLCEQADFSVENLAKAYKVRRLEDIDASRYEQIATRLDQRIQDAKQEQAA